MKKIGFILFLFLAVAAGHILRPVFYAKKTKEPETKNNSVHYAAIGKKDLYVNLTKEPLVEPVKDKVYAATVSHHFLTEKEISELFLSLRKQSVKTVVLVGPNHFNTGNAPILVSKEDFVTPWGILENNTELVQKIENSGLAQNEEQPFDTEHSISTLVGFIKFVFPKANFVPIIIKRGSSFKDAEKLGEWLAKNLSEDSLVLVSVDFSHHFNLEKTLYNDRMNLEILKSFNSSAVVNMEVDSKQSIALLFKYLEQKQAQDFNYYYTNAAYIWNNKTYEDVTSYFFSYYLKGEKNSFEYKKSYLK